MAKQQSEGRKANGASAGGKPEARVSEAAVERVGRQSQKAGPDGPDAREVGDTFKR